VMRALVCGAGGFIGSHLVEWLKREGWWVRGVDIKLPAFGTSTADDFSLTDLRTPGGCVHALEGGFDEVYQLAADMGGMGFIHSSECQIVRNNVVINANMLATAVRMSVPRYFFSSSVCVYRDMQEGDPPVTEDGAYPAMPDNEYGWEKLYSERMALTYARHYDMKIRIARFENTYGPWGTWTGGREKAPAAMCRKVAASTSPGVIPIWGDGSAVRCYTYIDDTIAGILALMRSDLCTPVNIGSGEYVTVTQLVNCVARVAGKIIATRSTDGPVGVTSRNFTTNLIQSLGWHPRYTLLQGIARTYPWIEEQVRHARA
jgi:GDP-D-mannose 3', 5'-epimerase